MITWKALLASCLTAVAAPAFADELPVAISTDAVSTSPRAKIVDFPDGRMWQIEWRRDADERALNLVVTKANPGKSAYNRLDPAMLHEISFKEGLTEDRDEADVREEGEGESDIWDGNAMWLLGSELAERSPLDFDAFLASGQASVKAPRGPERRYCLSFSWLAHDETRAMGGTYCKVMPAGETPMADEMLKALELAFN